MIAFKALSASIVTGALLALVIGSPAAAFELIQQSGQTGDYGTRPDSVGPEAKCGYTSPSNPAGTQLRWIKVFPIAAGPATGSSRKKVSWTVAIQKSTDDGTTWKTITKSAPQTGTATDSGAPTYKTVKLSFVGKGTAIYRAISTLKWLHGGSTTGMLKMRMTTYGVKLGKANGDTIFSDWCSGILHN